MRGLKLILFISIFLLATSVAYSQEYNVLFAEVDRFICKNQTHFDFTYDGIVDLPNLGYNKNETRIFNIELKKELEEEGFVYWENFDVNGSTLYLVYKNDIKYRIDTNGKWYSIMKFIEYPVNLDRLRQEYDIFRREAQNYFYFALKDAIEESTKLECIVGSNPNEALLDIVNIYNYPVETLNCEKEQGIFTNCNKDPFVNKTISNLWSSAPEHDRRHYKWFGNRIFIDLNWLQFNEENEFDVMRFPLIVISQSEFASSLDSGQSVYVRHKEYLQNLEKIPIELAKLKKDVEALENITRDINANVKLIKKLWISEKIEKIKNTISDLDKRYESIGVEYPDILGEAETFYSESTKLVNENPQKYYEDAYRNIAREYLSDLNSKLAVFRNKLNLLERKLEFYDTFTTNIISDINSQERTTTILKWAIRAILVSIALFILDFIYRSHNHWKNQIDIMKTLLDDLNEITKTSESYKDVFLQKTMIQYTRENEEFEKTFDRIFFNYKDLADMDFNKDYDGWLKKIQERISKDNNIALKIKTFIIQIRKKSFVIYPSHKPQYFVKQLNFDFYTKQLDYRSHFLFFFRQFHTWEIKKAIHDIVNVIEVINYQVQNYELSGNHNEVFINLYELDKKISSLFNLLVSNEYVKSYWELNKSKLKELCVLIGRY